MNSIDISTTVYGKYAQIGVLIGANMNTTADQLINLIGGSKFIISEILITNSSTNNQATAPKNGQFYSGKLKTGVQIFQGTNANGNNFGAEYLSNLQAATNYISLQGIYSENTGYQVGSLLNSISGNNLYFSLGLALGSVSTADIYIYGYILQ